LFLRVETFFVEGLKKSMKIAVKIKKMQFQGGRMKKLGIFLVAVLLVSPFVFSQSATGNIQGTVVLEDGSSIPGVLVTLTSNIMGTKKTITSVQGNFRFLQLQPGKYTVRCELEGFKVDTQTNIGVAIGQNVKVSVTLVPGELTEEIKIVGKSNIIDTKSTTVSQNFSSDMIKSLPTARNAWTLLNMVPGMLVDRADVGGNESGQQSSFYGNGTSNSDTAWNIDGANVTDESALGATPGYLNMNAYESLQVTMGANDITAQTGGTQLNFVSKRAGNQVSGDFHLYVEEEAYQLEHDLPKSITDKGQGSPGVFKLYQYGINFGGPIFKDKLFFFVSYTVQDIDSRTITQGHDKTWLVANYGKLNFNLGNTSGQIQYSHNDKRKWGRAWLGAASQDPSSLWNQDGPSNFFTGNLQHVFGSLMVNAAWAYTDGGFGLHPSDPSNVIKDGNIVGIDWVNVGWSYFEGGMQDYSTNRNSFMGTLTGNQFLEGVLGGDHEIKFGVEYKTSDTTSQTLYPNQRVLSKPKRGAKFDGVWFNTNSMYDVNFQRFSAFFADTITFGKLTVNLGLRYDREWSTFNAATEGGVYLDGHRVLPNWLPDLSVPKTEVATALQMFSPRISLTYDLTGDGKNVLKASIARYGNANGNRLANHVYPIGGREIDVAWTDPNGNGKPDWDEFDWNALNAGPAAWDWTNINTQNPAKTSSDNKFDPNLSPRLLDELSLGFEKALSDDISISLTGYYKKTHNMYWYRGMWADGSLETADNWYSDGNTYDYGSGSMFKGDFTFFDGSKAKVWNRKARAPHSYLTNHSSERYQTFLSAQLIFKKRLSNNWSMDASFVYSDWKNHYDEKEVFDKTNLEFNQDGVVAPQSGGSGMTGVYVNSRWQFRLSGLYQLPWDVNVSGVFELREGYVLPEYNRIWRPGGIGGGNLYYGKKIGDNRLENHWMLNLAVEKLLKITDRVNLTLLVNAYNVLNNDTVMKMGNRIDAADYGKILRVLNPGVFQFGARIDF
jgi:hypothetical protein